MIAKIFAAGIFLISFVLASAAQEQCSCTQNGVCSASQTCPEGYSAICTCGPTGCSSYCRKEGPIPPGDGLTSTAPQIKGIGNWLSAAYGQPVSFTSDRSFDIKAAPRLADSPADWRVLEFFDSRGELKVGGHALSFWRERRNSLARGEELTICVGSVSVADLLSHLSFISGERLSVASGDPKTKVHGTITGKGLSGLVAEVSKLGKVSIGRE